MVTVTVAVFSEMQNLNTSAHDLSVCMSVRMSCVCSSSSNDGRPVMVKMDPPKLVPPGTNLLINKDPPELIFLQNMDSL